jgi:hypothetical protein
MENFSGNRRLSQAESFAALLRRHSNQAVEAIGPDTVLRKADGMAKPTSGCGLFGKKVRKAL